MYVISATFGSAGNKSLTISQNDERWQLVQRIVSSPPFQKSTRLRDLLQFITEQTIHGKAHELTEQHIGNALFHKPSDYSPLEDSSVRVHARQLRLKLHEYFNEEGRNEPLILDIPKGSYAPVFRTPLKPADLPRRHRIGDSSRDLAPPRDGSVGPMRHSGGAVRSLVVSRRSRTVTAAAVASRASSFLAVFSGFR